VRSLGNQRHAVDHRHQEVKVKFKDRLQISHHLERGNLARLDRCRWAAAEGLEAAQVDALVVVVDQEVVWQCLVDLRQWVT